MRFIYLHGFASSPQSAKAQFFRKMFAAQGLPLEIPQLDQGDFERLTITRQLQVVEEAVADGPVVLIGSSLGGYLAALVASRQGPSRNHPVERLVLLAPAFQFPRRLRERYPVADLVRWKLQGSIQVFHYGFREDRPLGYQIMEDAQKYEEEPEFHQPALILHGLWDQVVPIGISQTYAAKHANVTLRLLDSSHELTNVLDLLWEETVRFLSFWLPGRESLCP